MWIALMVMGTALGADWGVVRTVGVEGVRGAAGYGKGLVLWGDGVWRWEAGKAAVRLSRERFAAGGCLADVDGDGELDLVGQLGTELVWRRGPGFGGGGRIDTEAEMTDCLGMDVLGRKGVLVMHRGLQLRHYRREGDAGVRWPYREIYSFYTASYQAGLMRRDVDGDGREDLIAGNYWVRSPESYELPWRLFAINTYHEEERSAFVRMAMVGLAGGGTGLVVGQAGMKPARVALFTPPGDVRQLWEQRRLDGGKLAEVVGLAVGDVDGDGVEDVVGVEREGGVWWWKQESGGLGEARRVAAEGALGVVVRGRQVWVIRERGVTVYGLGSIQ